MTFVIPSGKLRHVISIQQRVDVEDAEYGGTSSTWEDAHAGVRAEKKPLTGRQIMAAKAVQSEAKVCFRFRFIDGIDPTMRIVEGGNSYEIVGDPVDMFGEGRWLEVMTKSWSAT